MENLKIVCRNSQMRILLNGKEYSVNTFFNFGSYDNYLDIEKDNSLETTLDKIRKFILLNIRDCKSDIDLNDLSQVNKEIVNLYIFEFLENNEKIKGFYNNLSSINNKYLKFWTAIKKEVETESAEMSKIFSGLYDAITPVRNKMIEVANAFSEHISKIVSSTIQPFVNKIQDGLIQLNESLLSLAQSIKIPELTELEKIRLIKAYKQWGQCGWTYISNAPITFFYKNPKSQLLADKEALKYYDNNALQITFDSIIKFKKKQKDIFEAIACFKAKYYKGCALILFAVIDYILINKQNKKIIYILA